FYLNVPVGIATFVIGAIGLREPRETTAGRFDLAGFVLARCALAGILFSLSRGPAAGWASPEVVLTGVLGVIALVALIWVETHIDEPMLALRLFRRADVPQHQHRHRARVRELRRVALPVAALPA